MTKKQIYLDHDRIVSALDEIGNIVGQTLHRSVSIRIYGGAALILASNFRTITTDIDYMADKVRPQPEILKQKNLDAPENEFLFAASEIVGKKHNYVEGWFNYQVFRSMSKMFDQNELLHHEPIGDYPQNGPGLKVYVPALDYILAMKLHALRITKADDFKDLRDLLCLIRVKGDEIKNPADLVKIHARYYRPYQQRGDFEARIEQLWKHHQTGKVPSAVRKAGGLIGAPRYLSYGRAPS
jgi:hypothetical protein